VTPGPTEEIGRVATSIVDSLKASPIILALIVFNAIVFGMVYLAVRDQRASVERLQTTLLTMLANCTTPTKPELPTL
jgi:uncharacterized membrane protein affecting hemolysin expression